MVALYVLWSVVFYHLLKILVYAFLGAVVKVAAETPLIAYTLVTYCGSNTFHYNVIICPLCHDCSSRI